MASENSPKSRSFRVEKPYSRSRIGSYRPHSYCSSPPSPNSLVTHRKRDSSIFSTASFRDRSYASRSVSSSSEESRTRRTYRREDFQPGTVFKCLTVSQVNDLGSIKTKGQVFHNDLGSWLYKPRHYIVISRSLYHLNALPLFTFGGKGLISKNPERWREYLGIRYDTDDDYNNLSQYQPIEVAEEDLSFTLRPETSVHLMSTSISMSDVIEIEGKIRNQSLDNLRKAFRDFIHTGMDEEEGEIVE